MLQMRFNAQVKRTSRKDAEFKAALLSRATTQKRKRDETHGIFHQACLLFDHRASINRLYASWNPESSAAEQGASTDFPDHERVDTCRHINAP